MTINELFDLNKTITKDYLNKYKYPFEALDHINDIIIDLSKNLDKDYLMIKENVYAHKTASISRDVEIIGPCIICENAVLRHNAFIRENVIIGNNAVIGNSCEIKNSIIFDNAEIPHFNYVGDSIIGFHAHLGAGAVTSNLKLDKSIVYICGNEKINTNRRKVGAFIGDYAEVGCNSVLNPGSVIGKNTIIYPLSSFRGVIDSNKIYKNGTIIDRK
ncbi:MAG: hypothetical protein IKN46_03840 [Acholeplasmatales bacterium]|nr:hypothetical protein [Acholeplasmatales bacterium]